jgi:hypothetical protein
MTSRLRFFDVLRVVPFTILAVAAACGGKVDINSSTEALSCTSDQRAYNGACRALCDGTSPCSGDTRCVRVDRSSALCLDKESASSCSFLGNDTQCLGTGGAYVHGRSAYEFFEPYWSQPYGANPYDTTPYVDTLLAALYGDVYLGYDPWYHGGTYDIATHGYELTADGCTGNAHWQNVPATGVIACDGEHEVVRCRRRGWACNLYKAKTHEVASPAL